MVLHALELSPLFVLTSIPSASLVPGVLTEATSQLHALLIRFYAQRGRMEGLFLHPLPQPLTSLSEAFSIFESLQANQISPSIEIYDELLEGFAGFGAMCPESGEGEDGGEEEEPTSIMSVRKNRPNLLRLEQVEAAVETLQLTPSNRTYDILFRAYIIAGDLPQTENAFHRLRKAVGALPGDRYESASSL